MLLEQEQRRNEVFIDVIERLMVSIAADVSYVIAGQLPLSLFIHFIQLPSSMSKGWCVILPQVSLSLSPASLLVSSYFFFCVHRITLSVHVLFVLQIANFELVVVKMISFDVVVP